jgi:putative transposase
MLKGQTSRQLRGSRDRFWQTRYDDFNVLTHQKFVEKLRTIHRSPVARGLVSKPEDWPWSSCRHDSAGLRGTVEIESFWTAQEREQKRDLDGRRVVGPTLAR